MEQKLSKAFIWRQRIGFGISDYACNLAYLMVNTYLLFYYTNVAGIGEVAIGIMFVITKFVDAGTDYLVGALVDRTYTKMGRNRPWMLAGAPILMIGMILLFCVPTGWGERGKLAYAYISYIIFSFGYTVANIPMSSIVPTLSSDTLERTKIVTSRMMFAMFGTLTSSLMVLPLVDYFGKNGADIARGYRITNIILSIVVFAIILVSVLNTKEINPPPKVEDKGGLLKDITFLTKNRPYMLMLALTFTFFVGYLVLYASIQYYFTYVICNVGQMAYVLTVLNLVSAFAMFLSSYFNKYFSKRDTAQIGAVIQIVGYITILFCQGRLAIVYPAFILIGFGMGLRQTMFFSMIADTADYGEWISGKSLAGTQTAVSGFINKIASAVSSAAVSALLVWGAYDKTASIQGPEAVTAITVAIAGIPLVCCVLSIVVMAFYDLDKKYPQIRAELDRRKAEV